VNAEQVNTKEARRLLSDALEYDQSDAPNAEIAREIARDFGVIIYGPRREADKE
jgi:hypothetical protein